MTATIAHEIDELVDGGRCPHCGSKIRRWTRERVIAAGRRHVAETGFAPEWKEWSGVGRPDYAPTTTTVIRKCGSWAAFRAELGVSSPRLWPSDRILDAMILWREQHGAWPTGTDWVRSGRHHPSTSPVRLTFGSFPKAIREAARRERASHAHADVPIAPLKRAVDAWVAEAPFEPAADGGAGTGRSRTMFAELAGFDENRLRRILAQQHTTRRVADRILDTADAFHLWHIDPDLRAVLEGEAA